MTRRAARCLALSALLSLGSGCHSFFIRVSSVPYDPTPIVDRKTFWLFGCFPEQNIDVSAICPGGVSAIEEETSFSDVLLTAVTLEIYTPRTTSYYCRLPQEASP